MCCTYNKFLTFEKLKALLFKVIEIFKKQYTLFFYDRNCIKITFYVVFWLVLAGCFE